MNWNALDSPHAIKALLNIFAQVLINSKAVLKGKFAPFFVVMDHAFAHPTNIKGKAWEPSNWKEKKKKKLKPIQQS